MRRAWRLVALATLGVAPMARASGPFIPRAVFVREDRPDTAAAFAAGNLGVLRSGYARSYLVAAYRTLTVGPYDGATARALARFWDGELPVSERVQSADSAMTAWLAARARVPDMAPIPPESRGPWRMRMMQPSDAWFYRAYLSAGADAFRTATRTLSDRIARWGAGSAWVRDWVRGQDSVFAAAARGAGAPPAAPVGAPALLQLDRDYQRAAWSFYAERFDEAVTRFDAIAQTRASPWSTLAPYLAARALVRKATLPGADANPDTPAPVDTVTLADAERRLRALLAERGAGTHRDDAEALLGLVAARRRPAARLAELTQRLLRPPSTARVTQDLRDWLVVSRREPPAARPAAHPDAADLADWVTTFRDTSAAAVAHALAAWRATHARHWLACALALTRPGGPGAAALIDAAQAVPARDPAFRHDRYHALRLGARDADRARRDAARRGLDAVLPARDWPPSARNLLLRERFHLARSYAEAIRLAPRAVVTASSPPDGDIAPEAYFDIFPRVRAAMQGEPGLDRDGAGLLDRLTPLDTLARIVVTRALPESLHAAVARATWLRAIALGRTAIAVALAPEVARTTPGLADDLGAWRAAPTAEARAFLSALTVLRHPGFRPYLDPGLGRLTSFGHVDDYRDNWWCGPAGGGPNAINPQWDPAPAAGPAAGDARALVPDLDVPPHVEVPGIPTAPVWLGRQVLAYARAHPADARVPEALSLVVRAGRVGCASDATVSRTAWTLLHRNHARSPWARRTPVWYR